MPRKRRNLKFEQSQNTIIALNVWHAFYFAHFHYFNTMIDDFNINKAKNVFGNLCKKYYLAFVIFDQVSKGEWLKYWPLAKTK